MANPHRENRDSSLHVQDCQVWAEINYLDSATDYRECLPGRAAPFGLGSRGVFVMLDANNHDSGKYWTGSRLWLVGIILILVSGYVLYLVLDGF